MSHALKGPWLKLNPVLHVFVEGQNLIILMHFIPFKVNPGQGCTLADSLKRGWIIKSAHKGRAWFKVVTKWNPPMPNNYSNTLIHMILFVHVLHAHFTCRKLLWESLLLSFWWQGLLITDKYPQTLCLWSHKRSQTRNMWVDITLF